MIRCRGIPFRDEDDAYEHALQRELDGEPPNIKIAHVVGPIGKPECPNCGSLHEDDGGEVTKRGSMDWGPFYWECGNCRHQWGHA